MFLFLGDGIQDSKIYFLLAKLPTQKEFFDYFEVEKNSYMENFVNRIYNYIFYGSINLYEEYEKYYSSEYIDFKDYLEKYHHFNLKDDNNNFIKNQKNIYLTELYFKEDFGISEFIKNGDEGNIIQESIKIFFEEKC